MGKKPKSLVFHLMEDHALDVNLCVSFIKLFIFTRIQRVTTGLLYSSNSIRAINTGVSNSNCSEGQMRTYKVTRLTQFDYTRATY